MKPRFVRAVIVVVIVGMLGCVGMTGALIFWATRNPQIRSAVSGMATDVGGMVQLQQALLTEYPAEGVEVTLLNGHVLRVSITNSDANSMESSAQEVRAREIASFVKDHYAGIEAVDTIQINLVQQTGTSGFSTFFTMTYVFETAALP